MPLKIPSSLLNRTWYFVKNCKAWTYVKKNYLRPDIENLVPKGLLQRPKIITSLDQTSIFPAVDYANPRVQAALINSKATITASNAVIAGATIGTIVYVFTAYDSSKVKKIEDRDKALIKKNHTIEDKNSIIENKNDIIKKQKNALQHFETLQNQIRQCEKSRWCAFFLNQTGVKLLQVQTGQPQAGQHYRKPSNS